MQSCPFDAAARFPLPRECPVHPPGGYKAIQQSDLLVKVSLWNGSTAWLVTRYEDCRKLLVDPRVSSDVTRPGYPAVNGGVDVLRNHYPTLNGMDAPGHTVQRRMLAREFTARRINEMRASVEAIVDELITGLSDAQQPIDFVEQLAFPLATRVICDLLGVPYESREFFQSRAKLISSSLTTPEEAIAASRELCEGFLGDLIRRRAAEPQEDMLSRLVVEQFVPGHLSLHEMISIARQLLVAGHETTANTSSLAMLALFQHPDQFAMLVAEPELLPAAVEELLRYCDATHSGRRRVALEDIAVGDQVIRAGEGIILHNSTANRDPSIFGDADRLDFRRDNANMHLAFGFGPHACLGQGVARVELQALLGGVLRRLPTIRLAVPFGQLQFRHEGQIYGLESLPVHW
ncbi:MAG: cytochrome P450 [Burkholderiaceae bacterium]